MGTKRGRVIYRCGHFLILATGLVLVVLAVSDTPWAPAPLAEQLKAGGRMILPVGDRFGLQSLILITKDEQGHLHRRSVMPVLFVPMTGRVRQAPGSRSPAGNE